LNVAQHKARNSSKELPKINKDVVQKAQIVITNVAAKCDEFPLNHPTDGLRCNTVHRTYSTAAVPCDM
jgi:hypothetical protein